MFVVVQHKLWGIWEMLLNPTSKTLLIFIKDESVDSDVRGSVAGALGNMGGAAKPYLKDITDILKDKSVESMDS